MTDQKPAPNTANGTGIVLDEYALVGGLTADDQLTIAYRPAFVQLGGSVLAAILLQQINFRWRNKGRDLFYKFNGPCAHELYRPGDSWQEELRFTRSELETALNRIGTKIKTGMSRGAVLDITEPVFDTKGDLSNAASLVAYWTDSARVTWYCLNEKLYSRAIMWLYQANAGFPHYQVKQDSRITRKSRIPALSLTETTSEITTENTEDHAPVFFEPTDALDDHALLVNLSSPVSPELVIPQGTNGLQPDQASFLKPEKAVARARKLAPAAPVADGPTHAGIIQAYMSRMSYKLSGSQAARMGLGAKRALTLGLAIPDILGCYDDMKKQKRWATSHLSLEIVVDACGAWISAGRPGLSDQPASNGLPRRTTSLMLDRIKTRGLPPDHPSHYYDAIKEAHAAKLAQQIADQAATRADPATYVPAYRPAARQQTQEELAAWFRRVEPAPRLDSVRTFLPPEKQYLAADRPEDEEPPF